MFVTGGAGFLGGHIVDKLMTEGHSVCCLVRDDCKKARLVKMGVEVVYGDLRDFDSMKHLVKGFDCVFHAAAKVSDWGDWNDFYENTVLGTQNILISAEEAGVSKFLHVSTVDVYDPKMMTKNCLIDEESPLISIKTNYYYAKAKLMAEAEVMSAHYRGKIKTAIIRPATIYGRRDKTILPRFIDFIKDPESGWVDNFNPVMGLVNVVDVADLCVKAISSMVVSGRSFNATSDQYVRIRDFAEIVCKKFNIKKLVRTYPYGLLWFIENFSEFYGTLTHQKKPPILTKVGLRFLTLEQRFSIDRAVSELCWYPGITLPNGLDDIND